MLTAGQRCAYFGGGRVVVESEALVSRVAVDARTVAVRRARDVGLVADDVSTDWQCGGTH